MPEVPNDGARLTSDMAVADATVSASALAVQPVEMQDGAVEAELIGVPTVPVEGG